MSRQIKSLGFALLGLTAKTRLLLGSDFGGGLSQIYSKNPKVAFCNF
jgi:hypothetical protein